MSMNTLPQMDFPLDKIKLNLLYKADSAPAAAGRPAAQDDPRPAPLPKTGAAYTELAFPPAMAGRPYLISSVVLSADGKMAFEDVSDGPAIAKQNLFNPDGALADFWVLNALRASSDAVILGAGTLNTEPAASGHILDPELVEQRLSSRRTTMKERPSGEAHTARGESASEFSKVPNSASPSAAGKERPAGKKLTALNRRHPINFVVSFDGTDIPADHFLFNIDPAEQLPVAIMTSPAGGEYLQANFSRPVHIYDGSASRAPILRDLDPGSGVLPVITTGSGNRPDTHSFLSLLRSLGLQLVLVESPSYTSHLMQLGYMDEAFVNYSMIYAGGMHSPGRDLPFTHDSHPHVTLQALALHSDSFIYTRQRLYYGIGEG